jgi:hypothetical protein
MIARWILFLCAVVVLAGCAYNQAQEAATLNDIQLKGKDAVCARGCLNTYSLCAGGSGETFAIDVHASKLTACKSALKLCVSTCPNE